MSYPEAARAMAIPLPIPYSPPVTRAFFLIMLPLLFVYSSVVLMVMSISRAQKLQTMPDDKQTDLSVSRAKDHIVCEMGDN